MDIYPSRDTFHELSAQGNLIPVYTDLMADFETPVSIYAKLRESGPAFLFESIEGGEHIGRYTFLGARPRKVIRVYADRAEIEKRDGSMERRERPTDPLKLIEEEMAQYQAVILRDMPPFTGGAVGGLGYEYVHDYEPTVPYAEKDELGLPVVYYLITDSIVAFDRARQTVRVIVNAHTEMGIDRAYDAAVTEIKEIYGLLSRAGELAPLPLAQVDMPALPQGNFTQDEFQRVVEQTKEYILAGDIIQAVLSQRFELDFPGSPLQLYRALRVINPSPYMFLLETGEFSIIGASPEVHVRLTGSEVEIRPIAGTRPRGKTHEEDLDLEKDLLADEKERAEHLMLVDLARNDIGRVCRIGTVTVPEYMVIERYSHVMHIVSQVVGDLEEGKTAFDLMRATFPAGTVSGAPKVRAMQIIAELEKTQRGIYAGALGYFSYDGNCDSCIAIRTALWKDGKLFIQSGAGLVADSVPKNEYQETINKAQGLLKAVALAKNIDS